ncbi:MAG: cyclic-di-AMP receptor [Clostridia bacterium]|nr:cyclic-di-AMP receptor [Clostridia bacterium]
MKLVIAIVQDEDAARLVSSLMEEGFGVTKLATTGGFLRTGNTTLLTGVEDGKLDQVLHVIDRVCRSRKQMAATPTPMGTMAGSAYTPYPIEVTVGGATVFVLTVDQFIKV